VARIERFEDIEAWQKAMELAREVYRASGQGEFSRDAALQVQVRRAAVSVLSNIAEGFERGGDREFRQCLSVAKGSAAEVRAHIYLAREVGHLRKDDSERLLGLAKETSRLIVGFMRYLSRSDLKGSKFR
jgi:four helix bundle protein